MPWRAQFVLLAAIWGSSFLFIKVLGEDWPAPWVALAKYARLVSSASEGAVTR